MMDRQKEETETRMVGGRAQRLEAFNQCHCIMGCNWFIYYIIIINIYFGRGVQLNDCLEAQKDFIQTLNVGTLL